MMTERRKGENEEMYGKKEGTKCENDVLRMINGEDENQNSKSI